MDAKTAISILRDEAEWRYGSIAKNQCTKIADYIDQQAKRIIELEDMQDDYHPADGAEIRKYAELGELAEKLCCPDQLPDDSVNCANCFLLEICLKRAELLAEEGNGNA